MDFKKAWLVAMKDIMEYSVTYAPFISVFSAALFLALIFSLSIIYFFNNLAILINFPSFLKDFSIEKFIVTPYFNFVSFLGLIIIPIISARSFSVEKKSKTIELLFTYPFRESELVVGKILSSFIMYTIFLSIALFYLLSFLFVYTFFNKGQFEWGVLFTGILGLILVGLSGISLSVFVSSFIDDIVPAWLISFMLILFFWLVGQFGDMITGTGWLDILKTVLQNISWNNNFDNFSKGIIDLKNLAYFILLTLFFGYLSTISLTESK